MKSSATSKSKKQAKWDGIGLTRDEIHEAKRQALIAVASQVFRKKGYHNTSMDDVAAHLNVSKTVVYYYMKSKQDLLFHCYELAFKFGDKAIELAQTNGRTSEDKLKILISEYTIFLIDKLGGGALMIEDSALSPEHREVITNYRRKWNKAFRDIIIEGVKEKSFRDVNPVLTEFFIMGAIRNIHSWYSPEGAFSSAQIAENLVEFVMNGIKRKA